jgi:hypothetical protein
MLSSSMLSWNAMMILSTQLIMKLPYVGCHDMCFSFESELIQEFYVSFLYIVFLATLTIYFVPE